MGTVYMNRYGFVISQELNYTVQTCTGIHNVALLLHVTHASYAHHANSEQSHGSCVQRQ